MYSFNKYYKDGSGGTRDCRWFYSDKAAHISSPVFPNDWSILQPCSGVLLLCALFILVAEPYRDEYKCHNYLEPCVILSISLMLTAIVGVNSKHKHIKPLLMFTALVALLPIVYLCGVTVWWIYDLCYL